MSVLSQLLYIILPQNLRNMAKQYELPIFSCCSGCLAISDTHRFYSSPRLYTWLGMQASIKIHLLQCLRALDTLGFQLLFTRETTIITSCLLFFTPSCFWKGSALKGKNLFQSRAKKFLSDSNREGRQKQCWQSCISWTHPFFLIRLYEPGHDKTYKMACARTKKTL